MSINIFNVKESLGLGIARNLIDARFILSDRISYPHKWSLPFLADNKNDPKGKTEDVASCTPKECLELYLHWTVPYFKAV